MSTHQNGYNYQYKLPNYYNIGNRGCTLLETLGSRIKDLRLKQGMTQKQLAEKIGIREATLSRYENDKRDTQWEILGRIAEHLNTSSDYLLGLSDDFIPKHLINNSGTLSKEHLELILQYERLSQENKVRIKERIETLLEI